MIKPPLKRFPQIYSGRKPTLTDDEVRTLVTNPFIVEEKIDGTLISKEHGKYLLMLEDAKYKHSVYYTTLPNRYILVDVLNEDRSERLPRIVRESISLETGYPLPPLWGESNGIPIRELLNLFTQLMYKIETEFSEWSDNAPEGFVIKSERYMYLGGKHSRLDLAGEPRYTKDVKNRIVGYQW